MIVKAAAVQISPVLYSREGPWPSSFGRSTNLVVRACNSQPSQRR